MIIECTEKQLDVMNTILESIGMQKLSKDYMTDLSFEEYLNKYDFDSQIYHLIRHINEDNNRRRLYWYIMLLRSKVLETKEHKRDILNNHFRITTHKEEIIEFVMAENFNENSILLCKWIYHTRR